MGSLSRSRTSLNLIATPNMDRRRSISPAKHYRGTKSAATSATNTTKRGKLTKAQKFGSTSNLKLASEKISGFSVFSGSDERREPIMAYGPDFFTKQTQERVKSIEEEPRRSLERSKPVVNKPVIRKSPKFDKKLNRQSVSEQHFKLSDASAGMKRSISQQSLKQDIALEAVMIDMPSIDSKYDTVKSNSTFATTSSQDGSENEYDGISTKYFSRWGPVRGSNTYSNSPDVPVSQLSTLNLKTLKQDGPTDSAV